MQSTLRVKKKREKILANDKSKENAMKWAEVIIDIKVLFPVSSNTF